MSSIFKIGEYQKLQLVRKVPMGVYLTLPGTFYVRAVYAENL